MNPSVSARLGRGLLVGAAAVVVVLAVPAASGAETNKKTAKVSEWDFEIAAPKKIPKGDVTLNVRNGGPDDHELYVVRGSRKALPLRADGLTVDEEKIEDNIVGELEADRADTNRTLRVNLRPGRYELFCNMSGHYLGGMHRRFVVEP